MDEDEVGILCMALVAILVGWFASSTWFQPALFHRDNPWIGVVRLAFLGSLVWIAMVLAFFADASVTGIYVVFYLVLGVAVVQVFGINLPSLFGPRLRVDVAQRRNPAAGTFLACFVFATGLLFGGSLWGEADPDGDDEGGWWIPLGFFLAGWGALVLLVGLFWLRERGRAWGTLISDRNRWAARAAGIYTLSVAWVLTDAVAGDFYGWIHGLSAVAAVLVMSVTHEVFRFLGRWLGGGLRLLESLVYVVAALVLPTLGRFIERMGGLP